MDKIIAKEGMKYRPNRPIQYLDKNKKQVTAYPVDVIEDMPIGEAQECLDRGWIDPIEGADK